MGGRRSAVEEGFAARFHAQPGAEAEEPSGLGQTLPEDEGQGAAGNAAPEGPEGLVPIVMDRPFMTPLVELFLRRCQSYHTSIWEAMEEQVDRLRHEVGGTARGTLEKY